MKAAPAPGLSVDRHIKLVHYRPRSKGTGRPFGAIWQHEGAIRWTSPLIPENDCAPSLKRFADWFPEAMHGFDEFSAAVSWLQSVCEHECELPQVAQACKAKERLGLSCTRYEGPAEGTDLVALLDEGGLTRLPDAGLLQAVVNLHLKHLASEHAVLRGTFLLQPAENSLECVRLLLHDHRLVRIYLDRDTGASDVASKLRAESDRLTRERRTSEISFFVFAQLRSALPLRPSTQVVATGMRLPHITNGLIRLVWSMPISP